MAYIEDEDDEPTVSDRITAAVVTVQEGIKSQAVLVAFVIGQIFGLIIGRLT